MSFVWLLYLFSIKVVLTSSKKLENGDIFQPGRLGVCHTDSTDITEYFQPDRLLISSHLSQIPLKVELGGLGDSLYATCVGLRLLIVIDTYE